MGIYIKESKVWVCFTFTWNSVKLRLVCVSASHTIYEIKKPFSPEERERRAARLDHSYFYDMLIALPKGNRNPFVFWVGGRFQIITYLHQIACVQ